jgi:hypothetical protein
MKFIEVIQNRLNEIDKEAYEIVQNQSTSLTVKNRLMEPLLDEKKILQNTVEELEKLKTKNYFGSCGIEQKYGNKR